MAVPVSGRTPDGRIRTLIYGSCVSRDTFEYLPKDEYLLVDYVARQSLASAFSPPVTLLKPPVLESKFQQRMVNGDYSSSLSGVLQEQGGRIGLILWDLTDERLGFYLLPDDTVVTRSVELIASGTDAEVAASGTLIEFGSDIHLAMWKELLTSFISVLARHNPEARVMVLAPPWAESSESGQPTANSFGLGARVANLLYERYYEVLLSRGLDVVGRDIQVIASDNHVWGEAPFHYVAATYHGLGQEMLDV